MAKVKFYKFISIGQVQVKNADGKGNPGPEMFEGKPVYRIHNIKNNAQLGIISFYKPWKQYVFSSRPECVFNNSCLRDVLDFMEKEAGKE